MQTRAINIAPRAANVGFRSGPDVVRDVEVALGQGRPPESPPSGPQVSPSLKTGCRRPGRSRRIHRLRQAEGPPLAAAQGAAAGRS